MLSREQLRAEVLYDPDTGQFSRLKASGTAKAGDPVGWKESNGYLRASLRGEKVWLHRAAWLYVTGEWPENVDHRNGCGTDNRFANLRDASQALNCENKRGPQSNNRTGHLGVSYHRGAKKYVAYITVRGEQKYLGLHETAEQASESYLAAKRQLHEGCTI